MAGSFPGIDLLVNGSASGKLFSWPGGIGVFAVAGTFGGATIKLQFQAPDNATMVDAGTATTFTAANGGVFYLPPCYIQCTIVGGAPSGIYATAARVTPGH